jgi:hypothetical protein
MYKNHILCEGEFGNFEFKDCPDGVDPDQWVDAIKTFNDRFNKLISELKLNDILYYYGESKHPKG